MTEHMADFSDQAEIFDPSSFDEPVTIIGCGGIGSSTIPTLASMGIKKFVLYDDDVVEPRNVASQLIYRPRDIGRFKADVCKEYIEEYNSIADVEVRKRKFTANDEIDTSVVISAVDSMTARKEIWQAVKENKYTVQLLLDGRIGGQHSSLFAVDPLQSDWYEKNWLFSNEEASPLPCSRRAIIYPPVSLGAIMCRHLAHWHGKNKFPPNRVEFSMGDLTLLVVKGNDM